MDTVNRVLSWVYRIGGYLLLIVFVGGTIHTLNQDPVSYIRLGVALGLFVMSGLLLASAEVIGRTDSNLE